MPNILIYILIPLAVAAVATVLGMGLVNLARGGSPERSQKLMQWRVGLQAGALLLVLATLWLVGR
jgi:hypothetical protein